MIIDCHGHYTTAPPALAAWRDRQIAAPDGGGSAPRRSDLRISDDDLRETIEPNQLKLMDADLYTETAPDGRTQIRRVPERLTSMAAYDDGPDYSPDGRYIYFNSERTGTMQIWRMKPAGSQQAQITSDDYNNWFPHPSPDGKWIVFLSYEKNVKDHPENKDVMLRLMPAGGGGIQVLAKLFGGQGTLNVPSWSPDSRKLAFVSYRLVRL